MVFGVQEETDKYQRLERTYGSFKRKMRLPQNADLDKITAAQDNGVLRVSIPKMEEPPAPVSKRIKIDSKQ